MKLSSELWIKSLPFYLPTPFCATVKDKMAGNRWHVWSLVYLGTMSTIYLDTLLPYSLPFSIVKSTYLTTHGKSCNLLYTINRSTIDQLKKRETGHTDSHQLRYTSCVQQLHSNGTMPSSLSNLLGIFVYKRILSPGKYLQWLSTCYPSIYNCNLLKAHAQLPP